MKAMRERQEADQKAMVEEHKAAMQAMEEEMNALIKRHEEEISAAMQAFVSEFAARRLYHEAPDDVFELFVKKFSDLTNRGYARAQGSLRLVSKRCMQLVESVATRLTDGEYVETFPVVVINRCRRIEHIRCRGDVSQSKLESLEPLSACKGLETLEMEDAIKIKDLSPLLLCTNLKKLILKRSKVTDLSPLSTMTHLEEHNRNRPRAGISIKDLSFLPHCLKLQKLSIGGYMGIEDLSPLSECPDLEELDIYQLSRIKDLSFFEKGVAKLRVLKIRHLQVDDLSPLIKLQNLKDLDCWGIPRTTSLLPLARCYKLKKIGSNAYPDDLMERRPDTEFSRRLHVFMQP